MIDQALTLKMPYQGRPTTSDTRDLQVNVGVSSLHQYHKAV